MTCTNAWTGRAAPSRSSPSSSPVSPSSCTRRVRPERRGTHARRVRHCCIDGSPRDGESGGMKRNRRSRPPVQAPLAFAGFRFPPDVDHVTLFRWVQRFTPQLIDVSVSGRRDIASALRFFTTVLAAHRSPAEVITDRAPALANVTPDLIPAAFHNTGQYENNRCECDHGRLTARLRPMRGLKTDRTPSIVIRGHAFVQNLRRGHYELSVDTVPALRLATAFDELRVAI